ncbi:MAG: helix-turn-helix domain-containing protein [Tepidisphaeraceae bacterium]
MTDIAIRFGKRVRALREGKGITQDALANACRLDRTYLSGIERGRRNPALRNVARIANALGVTLRDLFEGIDC